MSSSSQIVPANILIVDDSETNRLLLSSQLQLEGYHTFQAGNGVEGVRIATEITPDLILMDVMMPLVDGFTACSQLKANPTTNLIPIVMVTALKDVRDRIKGIEAGADEFLHRPYNREELLVRVRSLIQLKRTRQHLEQERNRLQLLYNISQAINTQLNLEQMMADIITYTRAAVEADKGNIILINEKGTVTHKFLVRVGSKVEITNYISKAVMTHGLAGWLIRHNKGEIVPNVSLDARWLTLPDDPESIGSAIGVPLSRANRVVGVLILNRQEPNYFQPEHLALLETIGRQLTAAIENAYLFAEIDEQRKKLATLIAQSSDAIITTDETGQIVLINQAAENVFGLQADQLIDQTVFEVPQLSPIEHLFRNGSLARTGEIALPNGKILHANVSPIHQVGYVAVMQDITELKRLEEQKIEHERQEKQKVKETFARYMSPKILEQVLSKEPTLLAKREKRLAVVMFADLRGFTRMVVNVAPDKAIPVLNEHFTEMTEIVYEFGGTIFDLAGDELMIGFNIPFEQEDAVQRAVLAGVRMQRRFNQLRQQWYVEMETELGLGIGIDQGEVVVGNVGAETRMNYAMVGDAVNTAHRLVDLALDGQIIISEGVLHSIYEKDSRVMQMVSFEEIGPTELKGKSRPELLYRLQCPRTPLKALSA